ncbi:hypothetical protein MBAV_001624 [Candidatus Magnetobacterium bavaricum]|uniref:Uncharacterized protein n=1 Tax=Candidatus Magnetobacterium bavaricum TaxID=29290 RepID=A0A0F3GWA1_9BACT|nr:hypothetical protein MBAV_001624 [Candidatus Magnetobacterium bavaricum]
MLRRRGLARLTTPCCQLSFCAATGSQRRDLSSTTTSAPMARSQIRQTPIS